MGKKDSEKKITLIKIKRSIPLILSDYCKATGISESDIGFDLGYIISVRKDLAEVLLHSNQVYFFAGLLFAYESMKNKDDLFTVTKVNKKNEENITKKYDDLIQKSKENISYLG